MNKLFSYPGIEEWYEEPAEVKLPAIQILANYILSIKEDRKNVDENPRYLVDQEAVKQLPDYHYKTGCYDDPELVKALGKRNIQYVTLEMGAVRFIVLTPAKREKDSKLPLLLMFHSEDYFDVFWNQKTLDIYSDYIDSLEKNQDKVLIFMVSHMGNPLGMIQGQIVEGIQNYGADKKKIFVNVSGLVAAGISLRNIAGFTYCSEDGTAVDDPDSCIEMLGNVPVLNFSGRWVGKWKRRPLNGAQNGSVDNDWQIHSEFGQKMLEKVHINSRYESFKSEDTQEFWKKMGLKMGCHYVDDERWIIFSPSETPDKKVPVVVCLDEVNEPDDHAPVSAFANYYGYCRIAAQGDCCVIFFAMESPEKNDLIVQIISDAAGEYPIDVSRVYMTGHSHNGHFTQEFARRNPKVVAAIAPLGNALGLPDPSVSHEAVSVDDERAALMETQDMPTCIICGCCEVGGMVPVNQTAKAFETGINVEGYAASAEGKIAMWFRRLKAERIPIPSVEEMMAAAQSPKKAIRELGIVCDRSEIVYIDGFEHYVADLKNQDGNYHFRVIAVENAPHMVTPSMNVCAWNYMKKFARNTETGEVIELE